MTRCAKKFALFDYVDWILGAYVLFIGSRKRENDNCQEGKDDLRDICTVFGHFFIDIEFVYLGSDCDSFISQFIIIISTKYYSMVRHTIQSPWIYFLITDLMPSLIKYANEVPLLCLSNIYIYLIYIDIIYLSLCPNLI